MIRVHFQHFLRAVILAAFAIFFLELTLTGDITKYINPKYDVMSKIAAGGFILFFCVQLFRIWEKDDDQHVHCSLGCDHDHGYSGSFSKKLISYGILVFPLMTGFTFVPTVLDSSIAAKKGTVLPQVNRNGNNEIEYPVLELEHSEVGEEHEVLYNDNIISKEEYDQEMKKLKESEMIDMKNSVYSSYFDAINKNPNNFEGRKVKVSGFVYKEEGLAANQLVLSKFLITHCIADASILGFLTEFEQAGELKQDTWIEIEGTIGVTTYNGIQLPLIQAAKWKVIEEPEEPYIYPILTKES